eukprot:12381111-Alexandrium_andersonii.AAC.1
MDDTFKTRDAAFEVVTQRRSIAGLQWAYNRCINERAKAEKKAKELDWYCRRKWIPPESGGR